MLKFIQEPLVYLGQFMYLVNGITLVHRLGNDEHTLVRRFPQSSVDIGDLQFLVLYKAMHTLSYHAQTFLDGLLKVTANRHHLTHRFHG